MTVPVNKHVQALRDALIAEREDHIEELQARADAAAARGDEWFRKLHQEHVDRMRATPLPWETQPAGG